MPPTKLPPKGSDEANWLAGIYPDCSIEKEEELARHYGFANRHSFQTSMLKILGVRRKHIIPPPPIEAGGLNLLEQQVLNLVQKEAVSVGEISRQIDRSAETVIKTIDDLRDKSYEVILDEISRQVTIPQEPSKVFEPTEFKYFRKFYRIGLVADTQMCSKYQQVTLLYDAYAEFNKRQVDFVLHAGDLVDGKNMYRGQENEVFKHGADEQAQYVIDNYPKLERNRKTYIIGGQHDRSFYRDGGYNIIRAICKERKDLVDRGFFKAEFVVKGLRIGLQHPGGGVAYARSYRMQKIIENMIGFIASIQSATAPILQVFGHWHIACHLPSYMGIDAVSLPCFQSQTPYLEQKGLMPTVGYAIAEIQLDRENNLSSTQIQFIIMNNQIRKGDY